MICIYVAIFFVFVDISANGNRNPLTFNQVSKRAISRIIVSSAATISGMYTRPAYAVESIARGFQTKSGLKYYDIREGDGVSPRYGQIIAFTYAQYFKSKTSESLENIDSSVTPFLHKQGNGRIVRGLDEAIHGMRVGGKRRAIIPNSLGKYI